MPFTTINANETDADSPVNQTLMDKVREDLTYLRDDRLAGAGGHNHTSINYEGPRLGTGSLKTAQGTTSGNLVAQTYINVTLNDYSFFPGISTSTPAKGGGGPLIWMWVVPFDPVTAWNGLISVYNSSAATTYPYRLDWRYITASDNPAVFVLHDAGAIQHVWEAEDPLPPEAPTALRAEGLTGLLLPRISTVTHLAALATAMTVDPAALRARLSAVASAKGFSGIEDIRDITSLPDRWQEVLKLHFLRAICGLRGQSPHDIVGAAFKIEGGELRPR